MCSGGAGRREGGQRNTLTVLVGKTGGKRRLVRPRRRWQNDIKERLKQIGW